MASEPRSPIAGNVRAEIARRRVRHAEVAQRLGLSRAAFSRRLTSEVPFNGDELASIAELLGVPAGELLGEQLANTS